MIAIVGVGMMARPGPRRSEMRKRMNATSFLLPPPSSLLPPRSGERARRQPCSIERHASASLRHLMSMGVSSTNSSSTRPIRRIRAPLRPSRSCSGCVDCLTATVFVLRMLLVLRCPLFGMVPLGTVHGAECAGGFVRFAQAVVEILEADQRVDECEEERDLCRQAERIDPGLGMSEYQSCSTASGTTELIYNHNHNHHHGHSRSKRQRRR